jgi:hypothetical protein
MFCVTLASINAAVLDAAVCAVICWFIGKYEFLSCFYWFLSTKLLSQMLRRGESDTS